LSRWFDHDCDHDDDLDYDYDLETSSSNDPRGRIMESKDVRRTRVVAMNVAKGQARRAKGPGLRASDSRLRSEEGSARPSSALDGCIPQDVFAEGREGAKDRLTREMTERETVVGNPVSQMFSDEQVIVMRLECRRLAF
jgi:hypothetical protein